MEQARARARAELEPEHQARTKQEAQQQAPRGEAWFGWAGGLERKGVPACPRQFRESPPPTPSSYREVLLLSMNRGKRPWSK